MASNSVRDRPLPRMIVVDAQNIMYRFRHMTDRPNQPHNKCFDAAILVIVAQFFVSKGFVVRIITPKESNSFDRAVQNGGLLGELAKNGLLYVGESGPEGDDLLCLKLAYTYGAIIISNDMFRNHQKFREIIHTNVVAFDVNPVHKFGIHFLAEPSKFLAFPDQPDFSKVQEAHRTFLPMKIVQRYDLDLLTGYLLVRQAHVDDERPPITCDFFDTLRFPRTFGEFRDKFFRATSMHNWR